MKETLAAIFPTLRGVELSIEEMDLTYAVRNALRRSGVDTLAQLLELTHTELVELFPNRKLRSYRDVIEHLVSLAEPIETGTPGYSSVSNIKSLLEEIKTAES